MRFAGLIAIVLTVLAATLLSPTALAQDDPPTPVDIARHCVHEMHGVAANACEGMKALAEHGIRRMHELKQAGAPDRVLYEVASQTNKRIAQTAYEAVKRINRITVVCVRQLRSMGAPDGVIEVVQRGRRASLGIVRHCAHRSTRIVWRVFVYLSHGAGRAREVGLGL